MEKGVEKYQGLTRLSGTRAVWTGKIALDRKTLLAPYGWKTPRRVFVNSMSDVFYDEVQDAFILEMWKVMEETPWHRIGF